MMTYNEIRKHASEKGFKAEGGKSPTRKELEGFLASLEGDTIEEQVLMMVAAVEAHEEPVTREEIVKAAEGPTPLNEAAPPKVTDRTKRAVCHGSALEARRLKYRALVEEVMQEATKPLRWGEIVKAVEEKEGVKVYSGMWHNCGDAVKAMLAEGKLTQSKDGPKRATYSRVEPTNQLELPLG